MKYSKEVVRKICDGIINNQGRVNACKSAGISYETFTVWMETKPEFSEHVKKAEGQFKQNSKQLAILSIIKAMPNQWQSAAWWLERNFPEEFSLKTESKLEHSGKGVIFNVMSEEMQKKIESGDFFQSSDPE